MTLSPVFDDGLVQLYHGDALDVLEALPPRSVSTLLTDPPYGQAYVDSIDVLGAASGKLLRGDGVRGGMRTVRRVLGALSPLWTDSAALFVFCHYESYPDFFDTLAAHSSVRNQLVWYKRGGSMGHEHDFARDLELIIHATRGRPVLHGKRSGCVLDYRRVPSGERIHPTEKPVALLRHLLSKVQRRGDPGIVLDPFAGSGSTLVAARQLGLRAVGIEIDERWIGRAVERLKQTEILPPPTEETTTPTASLSLPGLDNAPPSVDGGPPTSEPEEG